MVSSILKITARLALLGGILFLVALAVEARDAPPGETFATGGIDLRIDNEAFYNGAPVPASTWSLKNLMPGSDYFFNFNDVKPGDSGQAIVSMHVKKSSAYLCLDFKNLTESDNDVNEPESGEDVNGSAAGELGEGLEFFSWVDDGDNLFEVGERPLFGTSTQAAVDVLNETTYPIGDTQNGGACGVNQTRYVGIVWCAGELEVDLATAGISCSGGTLGNEAQTDSLTVDVSIRAVPSKQNPKFVCAGGGHRPPHEDDDDDHDGDDDPPITFPKFPKFPRFPNFPDFPNFPGFPGF